MFPQASENNIRVVSKIRRKNTKVKVHHQYQWQWRQISAYVNYTGGKSMKPAKFATGINETDW
jgi:hypothetical protein